MSDKGNFRKKRSDTKMGSIEKKYEKVYNMKLIVSLSQVRFLKESGIMSNDDFIVYENLNTTTYNEGNNNPILDESVFSYPKKLPPTIKCTPNPDVICKGFLK